MEMINKRVLDDLRIAGMSSPQAEVVAAHIPDWSQFATKENLEDLRIATRQDIEGLRASTRRDIEDLRVSTRREFKILRHWMIAGFAVLSLLSDQATPLWAWLVQVASLL